ncbi:MAG: protein translocase subunit SecD [bacterium]|nr:protein translocase subunit SecD [bacterium]
MWKIRLSAVAIFIVGFAIGYFIFASEKTEGRFAFKLGLDLSGGTHLVYKADVSEIDAAEVKNAMDALRDVIERRVNLFGVAEPIVQVESTSGIISAEKEERLIVELPGITNVDEATTMIGQTPLLEFRLERPDGPEKEKILKELRAFEEKLGETKNITESDLPDVNALFLPTKLTGRFLTKATLAFDNVTGAPRILLDFDEEGAALFGRITGENVGKILAIYLDGVPISQPIIQQEILGGRAEITGTFSPQDAKTLVGRLNSGALPIPIKLLGSQTIGSSLGKEAKEQGVKAGIVGSIFVALFMVIWYRLPGVVAVFALGMYIVLMLGLFKIIPITLTAAGIAGFILSIGMAVDANVLIFERTKEELLRGVPLSDAVARGFLRAWSSIRDSNISSIITAVILFWFGTSLIEGFALVFALGVLVSMITAISVTRTLLYAISFHNETRFSKFLFGSGIK